jgi:hypothetical protein
LARVDKWQRAALSDARLSSSDSTQSQSGRKFVYMKGREEKFLAAFFLLHAIVKYLKPLLPRTAADRRIRWRRRYWTQPRKRNAMNSHPRHLAATLCLVSAAALGCSPGIGSSQNFDTPEASFASAKDAVANRDPLAFCNCLTDESLETVAGAMVAMGGLMKQTSALALLGGSQAAEKVRQQLAPINSVFESHGVAAADLDNAAKNAKSPTNAQALRQAADPIADKRTFIAEMLRALSASGRDVRFVEQINAAFAGELKDVKVEGDGATATLVGPRDRQPLEFHKSAAGWKIHLNIGNLGAATPKTDPAKAER